MFDDETRAAARRAALARTLEIPEWAIEVVEKQGNIAQAMREDRAALSGATQPRSLIQRKPEQPAQRGSGWANAVKIEPVDTRLADRIADHFAALDKAEQIKHVLDAQQTRRKLKGHDDNNG